MIKYQNLIYENNILYQGLTTKRVLKPNSNGLYKIKHKGEVNYHTLEEILYPERIDIDEAQELINKKKAEKAEKEAQDKFIKRLGVLCKRYNTSVPEYRLFVYKNKHCASLHDFSFMQHESILESEKKVVKQDDRFYVSHLCKEFGVKHNSYKSYLTNNNYKSAEMTKGEHIERIKIYKDISDTRTAKVNISAMCTKLGVTYDGFKNYLARRHLLDTTSDEGKLQLLFVYIEWRKNRKENSVTGLCRSLEISHKNYKTWLRNRGTNVSSHPIEWHREKIKEYMKVKR